VRDDHHAAFTHQGLAAIEVEEVAEPQAGDEDRVHGRVDVVRADVRQSHREHVGLPRDLDELLAEEVGERGLVHGLDGARLDRGEVVRRVNRVEDLAAQPTRVRPRALEVARKLARSLSDHSHSRFCRKPSSFGEGVGVERRLDLEQLHT